VLDLGEESRERPGLTGRSAENVEGIDVPCALPEGVERALAVEPGQGRLLDVSVAADALERLGHERWRDLADPVLGDCGGDAPERIVVLVDRPREPERGRRGRLRVEAEVGEHVQV
jgi:hypothetical protein